MYGRSYLNFSESEGTLTVVMLMDNSTQLICNSLDIVAQPINRFYLSNASLVGYTKLPNGTFYFVLLLLSSSLNLLFISYNILVIMYLLFVGCRGSML